MKEDQYFVDLTLKGQTQAFATLVERYQNLVFSIGLKLIGNADDAEDVAQESFVKAYHALKTFKGDAKFSTWIYRIAYNTALDFIKKHKKQLLNKSLTQASEKELEIKEETPQKDEEAYKKNMIKMAIAKLPSDQQLIISLYYFEELSLKEITEVTQLSESNVKVKLFRARKKLHQVLQKYQHSLTFSS
jgi:RNA polymerase sigma-70 factor (ECF subfamily)